MKGLEQDCHALPETVANLVLPSGETVAESAIKEAPRVYPYNVKPLLEIWSDRFGLFNGLKELSLAAVAKRYLDFLSSCGREAITTFVGANFIVWYDESTQRAFLASDGSANAVSERKQ